MRDKGWATRPSTRSLTQPSQDAAPVDFASICREITHGNMTHLNYPAPCGSIRPPPSASMDVLDNLSINPVSLSRLRSSCRMQDNCPDRLTDQPHVPSVKAALNPRHTEGHAIRQRSVQGGQDTPSLMASASWPPAFMLRHRDEVVDVVLDRRHHTGDDEPEVIEYDDRSDRERVVSTDVCTSQPSGGLS